MREETGTMGFSRVQADMEPTQGKWPRIAVLWAHLSASEHVTWVLAHTRVRAHWHTCTHSLVFSPQSDLSSAEQDGGHVPLSDQTGHKRV